MPLSVPVAKHTNFFWLLPSSPSALLAQLPHKGLPWFGSLNYILQLACPILVSAIIFPIVIVLPLWLLGNISHCLSTCAHGITQWALQKDCILPLTRVWCPSLLQMKWSLDPCFSQLFFHGQICLSPQSLIWTLFEEVFLRECVLCLSGFVSVSAFSSPFENLSTQEITSSDLTFPPLVLF